MSSSNDEASTTSTKTSEAVQTEQPSPEYASIRSRLIAMIYDGLIILFITTAAVILIQLVFVGDRELPPEHIMNKILKPFWFVPGYLYLAYHWTKSGQTPSMRVWKLKLVDQQGQKLGWLQSLNRYISSVLGLGLLWTLMNKERFSLQDILSKSNIVKTSD